MEPERTFSATVLFVTKLRDRLNDNSVLDCDVSVLQTSLNLDCWGTIYPYFEIGPKPAVFGCFTNAIAPPPIALESCSNSQDLAGLLVCNEKNFVGFFLSDVISKLGFLHFGSCHLA